MIRWIAIALLCTVLVSGFPAHLQDAACDLPTDGWDTVAPEEAGLDGEVLEAGEATVEDDLPYVRSVLVIRHGCLAYEHYYGDVTAEDAANVFSVTKSVTATLIGIAIADGAISSVHDSIADYLDLDAADPRAAITVRHLLWMLSGLGWQEGNPSHIVGMLLGTRDEVDFILNLPLDHVPGTTWSYSTADSHLLSAVLTAATGESAADFAAETLFGPLGIVPYDWKTDPEGINLGGTELWLTPRDMAKFGLLILNEGRWGEDELVSPEWMEKHIRGPLKRVYPAGAHKKVGVKEGDTPSFMALLPNGLSDPEQPEQGNWGGRFVRSGRGREYIPASDLRDGRPDLLYTIHRWRPAYQNVFQARMDWCVLPFDQVNHEPVAHCNGDTSLRVLRLPVEPGANVALTAAGSSDPDGDRTDFRWWTYREAGTFPGEPRIEGATRADAVVSIPPEAAGHAIHIILEVTDTGRPPLTAYRRVVLEVRGDAQSKPSILDEKGDPSNNRSR